MNHRNDEGWLDEIIARAVDIGKVEFDRVKWLDKLAGESQEPNASSPRTHDVKSEPHKTIWRTIMDSKVTRYSAAAVIALAMALVLLSPFGPSDSGGIVWAEVAAKVAETRTLVHREKRFFYEQGQDEPFLEADVTKYVSSEHGIVEEQYDVQGSLLYRAFMLKQSRRVLLVFPVHKCYLELPMDETFTTMIDRVTPKGLVEYFTSYPSKPLGRSQFDGHDVEGFEINDMSIWPIPAKYRFLFPLEDLHYTLWVDVENSLPVGAVAEFKAGRGLFTSFKKLRVVARAYDLRWDAELPEGTFDPNIPEDYTPMNLESITKENNAWIGFRVLPLLGVIVLRRRSRQRGAFTSVPRVGKIE